MTRHAMEASSSTAGNKDLPYRREAPMPSAELYEHHERRMLLCGVRRHRSVRRTREQRKWTMNNDIASVFEWFAQDSIHIAEQANEPKRRECLGNLALLWAIAAAEYRRLQVEDPSPTVS